LFAEQIGVRSATMLAPRLVGILALVVAGCAESGNAFDRRPPKPTPTAVTKATPVDARKALVGTPSWPTSVDGPALKELSEAARRELAHSPVPVLVVDEPKLLRTAVITTGPHWYALSTKDGGLTTALHGTRLAHDYPEIPPARGRSEVRGRPAFITENEGIVSASWLENGVAYSLDLECFERQDTRCQGAAHVTAIANRLRYVGGEGGTR